MDGCIRAIAWIEEGDQHPRPEGQGSRFKSCQLPPINRNDHEMDIQDKLVLCFLIIGSLIAYFFGHDPDYCAAYPQWCDETILEARNERVD